MSDIKTTVEADATIAENWLKSTIDVVLTYLTGWKRYAAIGVVALLAWHFFGGVFSGVAEYIPAREHITPATISDLSAKADTTDVAKEVAKKADKLAVAQGFESVSASTAQFLSDLKAQSDQVAAQSEELTKLEARLDAVETRLAVRKRRPTIAAE